MEPGVETVTDVVKIDSIKTSAYKIPTDFPESDGTIEWDHVTLVMVEITAGNKKGIGFTYGDPSVALFIEKNLKKIITQKNVFDNENILCCLIHSVRNSGNCGIAAMAISAIDNALWDLKAKLLNVSLSVLLGKIHDGMLLYGSGGFTSYSDKQTQQQFEKWALQGITHFKMKVGREPLKDIHRVKAARKAIGNEAKLFVDANGAYTLKQALIFANLFAEYNVEWFEEPVAINNLQQFHFIRQHTNIKIAGGEYAYNIFSFQKILCAEAVDVLQADATRCNGITTFLKAGAMCEANQLYFSSHCAPAMHLHASLSLPSFYIAEYFHDHERIENMLLDGMPMPRNGKLYANERPGFGFAFKEKDAEKFKLRY